MNIERMQPADFDAVYRLLTQSFPATERRGAAGQRALFSDSAYCVDILRAPDGGVQALIASWDFDDFVFLEHFAVDPACRSGGIGGQMLDAMLARCASAFTSGTASRSMRIMPTSSRRSRRAATRCRCTCSRPAAHAQAPSCARWRRLCTRACTDRRPQRSNKGISARSGETGGFGIGLAIARSIAEGHHGTIRAESPDGRTVIFTVELR